MRRKSVKEFIAGDFSRYFLLIALAAVFVVFGLIQPSFLNLNNLMDLLTTASIYAIGSCGLMMVVTTGDLNLATGATAGMTGAIVGYLMTLFPFTLGWYALAILVALAAAIASSLFAGFCNIRIGVPTFIATLAIRQVLDGITTRLTNNQMFFSRKWNEGVTFKFLGTYKVGGVVPLPILLCVALAVVAYIFTERTRRGRYLYATGANIAAATQAGIHVKSIKYLAFALCGLYLGIAGILWTSMQNGTYIQFGTSLTMPMLAVTMLGATFLKPGIYNVRGILVAAVLMTAISNGVLSTGAATYVRDIVQGTILFLAVGAIAIIRPEGLPKVTFER